MNIIETLKTEHDKLRKLLHEICNTPGVGPEEQKLLFPQLRAELLSHSEAEEKSFYTPLLESDKETTGSVKKGIEEHKEALDVLDFLSSASAQDPTWAERLAQLKQTVEHHLRHEETEMFPRAEKMLLRNNGDDLSSSYFNQKQSVVENAPRS